MREGRASETPKLLPESSLFHRTAHRFVRALYHGLWRADWRGVEHIPADGPALLLSNHPSYLDPLGIYVGLPRRVHWMAWRALFEVPLMGPFIAWNGGFPVDPGVADSAAFRSAARIIRDRNLVGVFPEGGRSYPSGRLFPFLLAPFRLAVRLGVPVVPVTVSGASPVWPRGRTLPKLGGGIEYRFHPPLDPHAFSGGARTRAEALARTVRDVILAAFRAPPDVLERSRLQPLAEADEHPLVQADRHGVPPLQWLPPGPDTAPWLAAR